MTVDEAKRKYGTPDKEYYVYCSNCPLNVGCSEDCPYSYNCSGYGDAHQYIADYMTNKEPITVKDDTDMVNHPNHYTNGGMECFDEMLLVFGKETVANFCLCNAWKYRYRAIYKNGEEDIKKSHWYMNKYKELTTDVV